MLMTSLIYKVVKKISINIMLQISRIIQKNIPYIPQLILKHTDTCPTKVQKNKDTIGDGPSQAIMKRPMHGAKVRLGFIPDNWFTFFHCKTGVSGPYIFGVVAANYLLSKEIYIQEHEYYTGISIFLMIYYAATRLGPGLGKSLDSAVDAYTAMWEKSRKDEMKVWEDTIIEAEDAQHKAKGQKLLMDAKKENIAMQLEAIYRERSMELYKNVKNRLDYQVKLHQAQSRIHQKWMLTWILENVHEAITPEFEQLAMKRAIEEIDSIAGRAK